MCLGVFGAGTAYPKLDAVDRSGHSALSLVFSFRRACCKFEKDSLDKGWLQNQFRDVWGEPLKLEMAKKMGQKQTGALRGYTNLNYTEFQ